MLRSACTRHPLRALPWTLFVIALVSGCDALPDETLTLEGDDTEVSFRFEFSSEQLAAGGAVPIVSVGEGDLREALRGYGFTVDEVVSARVVRATLDRVAPQDVTLGILDEVVLYLAAGGQQTAVARADGLPDRRTLDLPVEAGADAARYVTGPRFDGILELTPAEVPPNRAFVLSATVRFRIEVEGV